MKRIISSLVVLCMIFSMFSGFSVVAESSVASEGIGFDYATEYYPSIKSGNDLYHLSDAFDPIPHTFEAWIAFPQKPSEASVLMGNSADATNNKLNIEVNTSGNPIFNYCDDLGNIYNVVFSDVNLYTGQWIHLAITLDPDTNVLGCYVDGQLVQTEYFFPEFAANVFNKPFAVGGDIDYQNNPHFKGRIKQIAFYSDARSEAEILSDMTSVDTDDSAYIAAFDLTSDKAKSDIADIADNGWYLEYSDLWLEEDQVQAWRDSTGFDRAYSMAIIGDIQYSSEFYAETLKPMYQWIVDNKEKNNTVYSIGLGDITNRDTYYEWENAREAMSVMDGVIPYSVVRGNHDLKNYSASANNSYDPSHIGNNASTKGKAFDEYFAVDDPNSSIDYIDQFINNGENGGVFEAGSVMNTWRILEIGTTKWLLLNLDYAPSDVVLDWASDVVTSHPDCKVIVSTHSYLGRNYEHNRESAYVGEKGASGVVLPANDPGYNLGVQIWEKFASQHENIQMVLSGHISATVNPIVQRKGVHGNTVTEILIDGQSLDNRYDGLGLVAMFFFNEDGSAFEIEYYSVTAQKYYRGANLVSVDLTAEGKDYEEPQWNGLSIKPEGNGTSSDPYLVSNAGNLFWMAKNIKSSSSASFEGNYFLQTNDIDLGGRSIMSIGQYYRDDSDMCAFGGVYDGNGYKIQNGTVATVPVDSDADPIEFNKDYGYGLFGVIYGATIKNVSLDNIQIIGNGITGSIVGKAAGSETFLSDNAFNNVINCVVNSNCKIVTNIPNGALLPNSTDYDDDSRAGIIGGIVGMARSSTIRHSISYVDITASGEFSVVGGIVGSAGYNTSINYCINDGDISIVDNKSLKNVVVGGVVAMTSPTILTNDTLGDSKFGSLHILNSANCGDLKYTGSESLTVPSAWGGILGQTGRLPDLDNGTYTSTSLPSVSDTPSFLIKNCYNGFSLNSKTGNTASAATAGLVGRAASVADEAASTLWLADSASVYVTRTKGGENGASTHNGYNTYNYLNKKTAYSLLPIVIVKDELGNATVVANPTSGDEAHNTAVADSILAIRNKISEYNEILTSDFGYTYDSDTNTLTIVGAGDIPDYANGDQPWAQYASSAVSLVIGDGITSIGDNAFKDFTNLSEISIPDHISKISLSAFEGTAYIEDDSNYINNILYIGNVIAKVKQAADGKYTVKNSVTGIMENAFDSITVSELCYNYTKTKWLSLFFGEGNDAVSSDLGQFNFASESVNWLYDKQSGTVTIFGSGNMANYSNGNATPWYMYVNDIKSVVIEEGITSVGDRAFGSNLYSGIESVTIPEGVTSIGTAAFEGTSLKQVVIPSTVTTMKNYVFYGTDIKTVTIPDSLTSLGTNVFKGCTLLTDVYLPITFKSIGSSCFYGCTALTTIHYPGSYNDFSTITVGSNNTPFVNATVDCAISTYWEFNENTGALLISGTGPMADYSAGTAPWYQYADQITSVTVSDAITTIGSNAFNGLAKLATISIPETITDFGANAFDGTAYANADSNWQNGALYVNNVLVKINKNATNEYTIKNGITAIANDVFANITIDILNYPGTKSQWLAIDFNTGNNAVATDLGQFMFGGESINWLYDELTGTITVKGTGKIPNYDLGTAPWTQYRLVAKRIIIESGITGVGNHAFNGNKIDNVIGYTNVTELQLPEGLKTIGSSAFQYLSISRVDLPTTVTTIGAYAFAYSKTIESISYSTSATTISGSLFRGSSTDAQILKIYIPKNVTTIADSAFRNKTTVGTIYYSGTQQEWESLTITGDKNGAIKNCQNIVYNHVHSYTLKNDSNYHWQECVCGDISGYETHKFDDAADISCNGCTFSYDAPIFSASYVDPYGMINASKAVMLTNETALTSAGYGDLVVLSWCGEDYIFYKGINAFSTLSEIEDKGFDNPHILVKNVTEGNNFYLSKPASVFTQNYASDPVKEGVNDDGSDWSFNSGSGSQQFNTNSNIDIVYNNIGLGVTDNNVPSGDYKFYGFTITWNILDYSKNVQTNLIIENSRFLAKGWGIANTDSETAELGNIVTKYPFIYTRNKEDNDNDSLTLKNMYITPDTGKYAGDFFSDNYALPENVTFDTLFVDIPDYNRIYGNISLVQKGTQTSFTIKDSCFINYQHYNTKLLGNQSTAVQGQDTSIVLTDNIFNDFALRMYYNGVISYVPNAFTKVDISRNHIVSSTPIQFVSATGSGTTISNAPMKFTVCDNFVNNYYTIRNDVKDRNYTNDSIVSNNYTPINGSEIGVNIYFTGATTMNAKTWRISADGTKTSSDIQTMSVDGVYFDQNKNVEVLADSDTYNLKEAISTDSAVTVFDSMYNENVIEGYLDIDCSIPVDLENISVYGSGSKVYLKVKSPDKLFESPMLYVVNILRESDYSIVAQGLGSTYNKTEDGVDYYWLSWRGEVNASVEVVDVEMKHRVGTLYFSSKTHLDSMKQYIESALQENSDIDSIEQIISDANILFADGNTIKGYVMNKSKTLVWNSQEQSYGFRYNFNVHEDWYRGAVMYVVYLDENQNLKIDFSDIVVQQSGANVA